MNWFLLMMKLLPVVKEAVDDIMAATGKTPDAAFNEWADHSTKGKPNSPTLSAQ